MRATTLAKVAKFWAAALVLAVALTVGGAAFAQEGGGGGHNGAGEGGGAGPSGPAAPGSAGPALGPNATSSDACDVGPSLPTPPMFGDAGDAV